jgi:hypothetical protein
LKPAWVAENWSFSISGALSSAGVSWFYMSNASCTIFS